MPDNVFCGKCGELITGEPSDPCPKCGSTTRTYGVGSTMTVSSSVTVDDKVKRGPESWGYIYTVLGFVITIESTVIGMMTPLMFPWNVIFLSALL
jgi:hypothetical protein